VTHEVIWSPSAINAAASFLADDGAGLSRLMDAIDLLESEPRPDGSIELGSPDLRRVQVGRYRVLYEIVDSTVSIVHVGRLG
jgi:mRNA interferase RelE/StbE